MRPEPKPALPAEREDDPVAGDHEGNSVAAFIRSAVVKELNRRESEGGKA